MGARTHHEEANLGMKLAPARSETKADRLVSIDPVTLEPIGEAKVHTREEVEAAVRRAREAAPLWARLSFAERGAYLTAVKQVVLAEADSIAALIARENGKTVATALAAEVVPTVDLIGYFVKNAERFLAYETIPIRYWGWFGRRSYLTFPPLGVVAVIGPWNFPFSLPFGPAIMALVAGNTVVVKPSEVTPMVGLKLAEIVARAGLPADVFQVVTGDGGTGAALVEAPVDKIFFTGSGRTGRRIMEAAAKRLIPVTLELGGNAPMIVCRDADLDTAVAGAVWGSFFNAGQVCASVQRIYVDRAIEKAFTEKLVAETKKVRLGPGRRPGDADVGSLTSLAQLRIVEDLVEDARGRGAQVLTGGRRREDLGPGFFYEPTVLAGVDHGFRVTREEIFGPVVSVMPFADEDEAVRLANDTVYGLMASVWTRDIARGEALARRIESGTVVVNDHAMTYGICETPWGGVKESGFGRTHGRLGLLEFVQHRHIHVNRLPGVKPPWWFPETRAAYEALKAMAVTLGGEGFVTRLAAGARAVKSLVFGGTAATAAANGDGKE